MVKKVILLLISISGASICYSQHNATQGTPDTLVYDITMNNVWEKMINDYLRDTGFLKQEGVISFEYCREGDKEVYVIGGIGSRKIFMENIPSFYSIVSNQLVLIYTGIERKIVLQDDYKNELMAVGFTKLEDDLKEPPEIPNMPNFRPIPLWASKSYDVEMWRIEIKKGEIIKKEVTNAFLFK